VGAVEEWSLFSHKPPPALRVAADDLASHRALCVHNSVPGLCGSFARRGSPDAPPPAPSRRPRSSTPPGHTPRLALSPNPYRRHAAQARPAAAPPLRRPARAARRPSPWRRRAVRGDPRAVDLPRAPSQGRHDARDLAYAASLAACGASTSPRHAAMPARRDAPRLGRAARGARGASTTLRALSEAGLRGEGRENTALSRGHGRDPPRASWRRGGSAPRGAAARPRAPHHARSAARDTAS